MSLGAPSGPPAYTLSLCSSVYRKLYDLGANFTGHVVWGRSLSIRVFFSPGNLENWWAAFTEYGRTGGDLMWFVLPSVKYVVRLYSLMQVVLFRTLCTSYL